MKATIGSLIYIVIFCFFLTMHSSAQGKPFPPEITHRRISPLFLPPQPNLENMTRFKISCKKASEYTSEDWGTLIDSTWGAGQTVARQLTVFDTFWDTTDRRWAGFPNLVLNWDSLRAVNRSQIGSGLSRGRFYALMSRMWLALLETHSYITDDKIETIYGTTKFQYRSGVPLLVIGTGGIDLLGAAVTPLPDSSGLVYRITPGNPLGLAPGDLVLGYEGIPWKQLYGKLLDGGVPVSHWWSSAGTTPESRIHEVLSSVGSNWGMFDTIDIVKNLSGDTLHLPTASLSTITPSLWATEQVPIAGVPMPQGSDGTSPAVSWGLVQGTNIGYVYVWDWYTASTPQLFHDAIYDLRNNKNVDGLVIDFRTNWGGDPMYANGGLSQLFNFDPTSNISSVQRNNASNRMSFSIPQPMSFGFTPTAHLFDRPIAVLIGPACLSAGDYVAFFMRFHPMARFFGKPTNGAFVNEFITGDLFGWWEYQIPISVAYSNVSGEGHLIHKCVQPDENVWLTRDGVARDEDDVVKRALQWITTLTHAHDITVDQSYARPNLDSVHVTAMLANSLNHAVTLSATVMDSGGVVRDSILLYNDGMHGDGQVGDSIWGCHVRAPLNEGIFKISLRTDDITEGSYRKLPNIVRFATCGPLTLNSVVSSKDSGSSYTLQPFVRNNSSSFTVHGATVTLRCNDPWVTSITQGSTTLADLAPGDVKAPQAMVNVVYNAATFPGYFNIKAEIAIDGWVYWTDSTKQTVTGIGPEKSLPVRFALDQNYPNPFNPSTMFSFSIPSRSFVSLKVIDLLGREVTTIVSKVLPAGNYFEQWNASAVSSGVYFYHLQANNYSETKKLLLLK